MTIFISYYGTLKRKIWKTSSTYGEVKKCTIPLDRNTVRKRGFGFVEIINNSSEKKCHYDLQDVEWMGKNIRVYQSEQRARSSWRNRLYENKKQ